MSFNTITKIAAGAALGLSLFSGVALADAHAMAIDDDLAAKVQESIALLPPSNEGTSFSQVSVMAEDGMLVVDGLVESNDDMQRVTDMLQEMEGLDMDKVQNNLVVQ